MYSFCFPAHAAAQFLIYSCNCCQARDKILNLYHWKPRIITTSDFLSIIFAWLKNNADTLQRFFFSSLFVVNFRDRLVCWDVLIKIEELCFDCSPQRNTILKVSCISKENGDLKGTQKFDGKQPSNRLEQVKFFFLAVLPTNLVTKLTVSRGISH